MAGCKAQKAAALRKLHLLLSEVETHFLQHHQNSLVSRVERCKVEHKSAPGVIL
jgi:hypothetical protein